MIMMKSLNKCIQVIPKMLCRKDISLPISEYSGVTYILGCSSITHYN